MIESTTLPALLRQLESERFILYLKEPCTKELTLAGYNIIKVNDSELDVEVHKEGNLTELMSALAQQGVVINSMRNKSNRLEEMFLRITQEKE